jgi:DUF4097 and DUF4098 domain-containing protein YvlB
MNKGALELGAAVIESESDGKPGALANKVSGLTMESIETSGGPVRLGTVATAVHVRASGGAITVGDVQGEADLSTSGGDIRIGDVQGEARLSSSGGHIQVGKVAAGATLRTSGGNIDLGGAVGQVVAWTAGGNVRLENVRGSIDARSSGGNVLGELVPMAEASSSLASFGGDVALYLPATAKATVHARIRIRGPWETQSQDCDIRADFPAEDYARERAQKEIRATYRLNGGGQDITLKTVNGDIQIRAMKEEPESAQPL